MALDSHYTLATSIQEYFVDQEGAPLADGYVYFYKDNSRTVLKPVYQLTGSPPDYTNPYTELPNPIRLNLNGTFSDNEGNDILPYYKPYDDDGNIELYYVVVQDSSEAEICTREAWPNVINAESNGITDFTNFIPNGQFFVHNYLPYSATDPIGSTTGEIDIAPGGWSFNRTNPSTSTDYIQFYDFGITDSPQGYPRFGFNLVCETPGTDTIKDLRIKFADVNKFASTTEYFTIFFTGQTLNVSNLTISLLIYKNFGSGGSPESYMTLQNNIVLTPTPTIFFYSFIFGVNDGETLGANNDDYLQFIWRYPNQSCNAVLTNFGLTAGQDLINVYPTTTVGEFVADSIAGNLPVPAYDGSDLYLSPRLGPTGFIYDLSEIGDAIAETQQSTYVDNISTITNRLKAVGESYPVDGYSPLGIPYRRIFNAYNADAPLPPMYGTGYQFVNCYPSSLTTNLLILVNNQLGSETVISNGTPSTTFTLTTVASGTTTYDFNGYAASGTAYIVATTTGPSFAAWTGAGDSGLTVTIYRPGVASQYPEITAITGASLPAAGTYFKIATPSVKYTVWFTVNGAGSEPVVGGTTTYIPVALLSTMSISDFLIIIAAVLNAKQVSTITTVAQGSLPAGSYFNFYANSIHYFIWYESGGTGSEPIVANAIGYEAAVAASATAAQIAETTMGVINSAFVGTPDMRGAFVRGWNDASGLDPGAAARYAINAFNIGDVIGSYQFNEIYSHSHTIPTEEINVAEDATTVHTVDVNSTTPTGYTGGAESRPYNMSVNWVVKY